VGKSGSTRAEAYQPDRGHFVYLNWTPHAGTEQAGGRPGLVLSPMSYNIATGLMLATPITNQVKGSPWEVIIPPTCRVTGCVLSNQVRALDWLARGVTFHSIAPESLIDETLARIAAILGI
jgi:mRNA interferase MazF